MMTEKKDNNFWQSIGIVSLLIIAINLIKQINEDTSTKLYDQKSLKEIEDDEKFKEIYGRPRKLAPPLS